MYFIFFFLLFHINFLQAESKVSGLIYSSTEGISRSNFNQSNSGKNNFLIQGKYEENLKIAGEIRKERQLGSLEYKTDFTYFSLGHRYKPIYGFYFLRDTYSYSAFQNPVHGVVPQPLETSSFLGLCFKDWGFGSFLAKKISENKPGIYLKSPKDILGFAFAKETGIYFLSVNLRDEKIKAIDSELTINSQIYGKRESYYGYFNSKLFNPEKGIDFRFNVYKDTNGNLANINQDNFGSTNEKLGIHSKLSLQFYNRIEHFSEIYKIGRDSMTGGNAAFFHLGMGALCIGGRVYESKQVINYSFEKVYSVSAGSMSYEWKKNANEAMIRIENRENKDKLLEIKSTIRPVNDWRLEISALFLGRENKIHSIYEQWSDGENINTIFTDRNSAIKLKVIGSYAVINLSGSRTKFGEEIYFGNVQFKFEF